MNTLLKKKTGAVFKSALILILSAKSSLGFAQEKLAGATEGEFTVDSNGAAVYSVPVDLPPGTNGMQPEISLEYNSQSPNGVVGFGWSLSGISMISRCNQTLATDGKNYDPYLKFEESDRFCIDGQRLIAVDGDYGDDNTQYRTEIESWTKFISHGRCGKGPCEFTAISEDGSQKVFGGNKNSRVEVDIRGDDDTVRTWSISKEIDRNKNTIEYRYAYEDNEHVPYEILYTGNDSTGMLPARKITFGYESRSDPITHYLAGTKIEQDHRLKSVKTFVFDELVKQYKLDYRYSYSTRQSLLESIEECGPSQCLPKTKFTWFDSEITIDEAEEELKGGYHPNTEDADTLLPADINGDGLTDLIWAFNDGGDDFTIRSVMSKGDGNWEIKKEKEIEKSIRPDGNKHDTLIPADINGDGLMDVLWARNDEGYSGDFTIRSLFSKGNGDWDLEKDTIAGMAYRPGKEGRFDKLLPGDINGDGLTDLVWVWKDDSDLKIRSIISEGDGQWQDTIDTVDARYKPDNDQYHTLMTGDVNGDGLMDIIWAFNDDEDNKDDFSLRSLISEGNGEWKLKETLIGHHYRPESDDHDTLRIGDINGDGLSDLIWIYNAEGKDGDLTIRSVLSRGNGFWRPYVEYKIGGHMDPDSDDHDTIRLGDVNGDGLTDIILANNEDGKDGRFTIRLITSLGDGSWNSKKHQAHDKGGHFDPDSGDHDILLGGDANGDGITDLIWAYNGDEFSIRTKFIKNKQNNVLRSNLIARIENGEGQNIAIQYAPLTDEKVYKKGNDAKDYDQDVMSSMHVVSLHQVSDEAERSDAQTFQYVYFGAKSHRLRGWQGFDKILRRLPNGLYQESEYYQSFPFTQLHKKTSSFNENGELYGINVDFYGVAKQKDVYRVFLQRERELAFNKGVFIHTLEKEHEYDLNNKRVLLTHDKGDIQKSDDDVYTCYRYANGDYWQEFFLKSVKQSKSYSACKNGGFSFPQTGLLSLIQYDYDNRMNVIQEKVWSDQRSAWIKGGREYDKYGNVVAKISPKGHISKYHYDEALKTFVVESVSPPAMEGSKRLREEFTYDPRFGIQTSLRDANGIIQYQVNQEDIDELGRVLATYVTHPDKDKLLRNTRTFYKSSDSGELIVEQRQRRSWDSHEIYEWQLHKTFYDSHSREYRTTYKGPMNKIVNQLKFYNRSGTVEGETLPFFDGEAPQYTHYQYHEDSSLKAILYPNGAKEFRGLDEENKLESWFLRADPKAQQDEEAYVKNQIRVNSRGLMIWELSPNGGETHYQYDRLGQRISSKDALGVVTKVTYDSLGQTIRVDHPSKGVVSYGYDRNGNLISTLNDLGYEIRYQYDGLDRPIRQTSVDALGIVEEQIDYFYDEGLYGNGKLSRVVGPEFEYIYRYNRRGELIEKKTKIHQYANTVFTQQYAYNALGLPIEITYPDGSQVKRGYYKNGQLKAIHAKNKGQENYSLVSDFAYDNALGHLSQSHYKNGVTSTFDYDQIGRLSGSTTANQSKKLLAFDYGWNNANKLLEIRDKVNRGTDYSQLFTYTDMGHLRSAHSPETYGKLTYRYDLSGNVIKKNSKHFIYGGNKRHQLKYACTDAPELCDSTTANQIFVFDAAGNLSRKTIKNEATVKHWYYEFDTKGRLINVDNKKIDRQTNESNGREQANLYTYGLYRDRIIKTEKNGDQTFYFSPEFEIVRSEDGSGLVYTNYIFGPQGLVRAKTKAGDGVKHFSQTNPIAKPGVPQAGDTLFFTQDHLGSASLITDTKGELYSQVVYKPFGGKSANGGIKPDNNAFRASFTGKELDRATQLHYFESRYYDADVGRFISPDPQAQYDSPYIYGNSDPVGHIDPDGERAMAARAIGRALATLLGAYSGAVEANGGEINPANWDWESTNTWAGVAMGASEGLSMGHGKIGSNHARGIKGKIQNIKGLKSFKRYTRSKIDIGKALTLRKNVFDSKLVKKDVIGGVINSAKKLGRTPRSLFSRARAKELSPRSANLHLGKASDKAMKYLSRRPDVDPDGYFDVVAHGNSSRILDQTVPGRRMINANKLAYRLITDSSWVPGQPIRLLSCSVGCKRFFGKKNFAQKLSKALQVEVLAPKSLLLTHKNGEYNVLGGWKQRWGERPYPEGMKTFRPEPLVNE